MDEKKHKIIQYALIAITLLVALAGSYFGIVLPYPEIPEPGLNAEAANTACYREMGGARWVCGVGGSMVFENGATLEIQEGAALDLTGYVTSTLDSLTINNTLTVSDYSFTYTTPLTLTGVLTNVRLLFYQVH